MNPIQRAATILKSKNLVISLCIIASTSAIAGDKDKYDQVMDLRNKVMMYHDKKLEACINASPLQSAAKQCRKESNVKQVQDDALYSARNCEAYYRRGSTEQLDCKISVYQSALDAMDNRTPYKGWVAPDGSSKPNKQNTSVKI